MQTIEEYLITEGKSASAGVTFADLATIVDPIVRRARTIPADDEETAADNDAAKKEAEAIDTQLAEVRAAEARLQAQRDALSAKLKAAP